MYLAFFAVSSLGLLAWSTSTAKYTRAAVGLQSCLEHVLFVVDVDAVPNRIRFSVLHFVLSFFAMDDITARRHCVPPSCCSSRYVCSALTELVLRGYTLINCTSGHRNNWIGWLISLLHFCH